MLSLLTVQGKGGDGRRTSRLPTGNGWGLSISCSKVGKTTNRRRYMLHPLGLLALLVLLTALSPYVSRPTWEAIISSRGLLSSFLGQSSDMLWAKTTFRLVLIQLVPARLWPKNFG